MSTGLAILARPQATAQSRGVKGSRMADDSRPAKSKDDLEIEKKESRERSRRSVRRVLDSKPAQVVLAVLEALFWLASCS